MNIKRKLESINTFLKGNKLVNAYDIDDMPLFEHVEIETINRCNGKCSFCPVNALQPQREYAKMPEELFKHIIDQLSEIDYDKEICLTGNSEPLLDERAEDFIEYTRNKCPKAYIMMWTNGSLLNWERFSRLEKCMNRLFIDMYGSIDELSETEKRITSMLKDHGYDNYSIYEGLNGFDDPKKVILLRRDINEILSTRGGQAPNKKTTGRMILKKCVQPFKIFTVRSSGKVSLCFCDALGKYTLGDVSTEPILEIWKNSPELHRVRKEMQKNGRRKLMLCKDCDFEA